MKTKTPPFLKAFQYLSVLFVVAIALTARDSSAIADTSADPAQVRVVGDTVYYEGTISEGSYRVFDAAMAKIKRGQITRMVIGSGGGDTRYGRKIGQWVQKMGIIVEVDKVCFSSCSNYIFPAGRGRVIRADAFVGWHGNDRGMEVEAARAGLTLEAFLTRKLRAEIDALTPKQVAEGLAAAGQTTIEGQIAIRIEFARQRIVENTMFFKQLGLKDAFSVCAVGDVLKHRPGWKEEHLGWSFSIEDMERFGMVNTTYLGDGAYEDSSLFRKYVMRLSADECLSLLK